MYSYLPEQPRAWALCETYLEQAAWTFRPVKRDEIINDILAPTYRALKAKQIEGDSETHTVSPHKLAVLFLIFALGTLVDLTIEPCQSFFASLSLWWLRLMNSDSKEAEMYYHLSRACIALRPISDSPELATVQAILLMAAYHGMSGKLFTMDNQVRYSFSMLHFPSAHTVGLQWVFSSLGAKIAQSVRLLSFLTSHLPTILLPFT